MPTEARTQKASPDANHGAGALSHLKQVCCRLGGDPPWDVTLSEVRRLARRVVEPRWVGHDRDVRFHPTAALRGY